MIEILNKLINIVIGSSNVNYLLSLSQLKQSYIDFIFNVNADGYMSFDAIGFEGSVINFDYKLFLPWLFSSPDALMSFVFYIMVTFGIIYFFIIVPFRLIKQLLPKSVRSRKGTNKA